MANGSGAAKRENRAKMKRQKAKSALEKLFSQENLWALILALMVIFLLIALTGTAPQWIYQGF